MYLRVLQIPFYSFSIFHFASKGLYIVSFCLNVIIPFKSYLLFKRKGCFYGYDEQVQAQEIRVQALF